MKYSVIALLCLVCFAVAEEETADPGLLLTELEVAVQAKDTLAIDQLAVKIAELAQTSKDQPALDALAARLSKTLKLAKGNWGTLRKIVDALGELRSKKGLAALKKIAFKKKVKEGDEEDLQARAVLAVGKMRDTRQINAIAEVCKNESKVVAKAAYEAFKHYGTCSGKIRKNIAHVLMKRIDMEYPSSGGQGGKTVSAEKQERWNQLNPTIVASLQAICRQSTINDIENWREWWKENKKSPRAWREPKE